MSVDFFLNGLCFVCHDAQNQLDEFLDFHSETEASWARKDKELQDKINDKLKNLPEEIHEEVIDSYGWHLHLNQIKYPSVHRESLVITIHNFFENSLNELCNILNESDPLDLKLKHLHGSGIERALLYLSKVSRIDLSGLNPELQYLKNVNQLRNQIVHNGSRLPEDAKCKVNVFVEKNQHISGRLGSAISINEGFINEYIQMMNVFFKKLDIKIQKYMTEYNR